MGQHVRVFTALETTLPCCVCLEVRFDPLTSRAMQREALTACVARQGN